MGVETGLSGDGVGCGVDVDEDTVSLSETSLTPKGVTISAQRIPLEDSSSPARVPLGSPMAEIRRVTGSVKPSLSDRIADEATKETER